jgi:hypothetical protein
LFAPGHFAFSEGFFSGCLGAASSEETYQILSENHTETPREGTRSTGNR